MNLATILPTLMSDGSQTTLSFSSQFLSLLEIVPLLHVQPLALDYHNIDLKAFPHCMPS